MPSTIPTGVCEKDTPPEEKTLEEISMKSTESGTGEKCLLLSCKAKARITIVVLQTLVSI